MIIGISPTVDFAFKLMPGSTEQSRVTVHFLNSILVNQPRITQVEILNPFLAKDRDNDKLAILDILATDEHGRRMNIEMQATLPAGMAQRLIYYASSLYVGQLYEGNHYTDLRPAISICVLTQPMFPQSSALHLDFRLRESSENQILTDDLQIHLLQLENLRATAENFYHAPPTERWAYFLKNADKLTTEEVRRLFPEEEAAGVLQMISQTPEQLMLYNARLKFQRDAEARPQKAREDGIREGQAKGQQEGRQEGFLAGRIVLLQEMLGLHACSPEELAEYTDQQLQDMAQLLQRQLRGRAE
jgi:predicted transposase/invertase (TIGR01784 family)